MLSINPIRNTNYIQRLKSFSTPVSFCANRQDTFEKSSVIEIYNYDNNKYWTGVCPKDLTKPAKIEMHLSLEDSEEKLILDYNPNRFDYLKDKQTGQKIKTMILQSDYNRFKTTYHFLSENLDREFGYVQFLKCENPRFFDCAFKQLLRDIPEVGLVGGRLIVDYLQNFNDEKIGGVGILADKLSVKCCLDNGLPLKIVSVADRGSHVAHYIRGKRFYSPELEEDTYACKFLRENYGKTDVNQILEELIKNAKNSGDKLKPQLGFLMMYMPQKLIMKYVNELRLRPIP